MSCPGCGKPTTAAICPYCGVNADIYIKTVALSNAYYNKGLALAKAGDLTGAAKRLLQSVLYNKRNMQARNLLGLVYCTTGRLGEALKHWVISLSFRKKENPADAYMAWFQKNPRGLEAASDAVRMYNQALTYLRQKSEDMAVIQLKKATDLNPDFVDAQCLLALCYMLTKDKTRALQCVERALAKDAGHPTAWRYYRELTRGRNLAEVRTQAPAVKAEKAVRYPVYAPSGKSGLSLSGIICFLVGALCTFALVYILYLPQQLNERETKITTLQTQLTEAETTYREQIETKDEAIASYEDTNQTLAAANAALTQEVLLQDRIMKVYTALSLHRQDRFEEAITALAAVAMHDLPSDIAETYVFVDQSARQILEKQYYNDGIAHYNAGRYAEGKTALDLAVKYEAEGSTDIDDAYYFLGLIAENDEDNVLAVSYYESVLAYPESNRLSAAQGRLDILLPLIENAE